MRVKSALFPAAVLAILAATSLAGGPARADGAGGSGGERKSEKVDAPVVDATQVYYGDPRATKKPAVVDADKVFGEIPEYKKIRDDGLTEKDARYAVLLHKATCKFKKAVKKAAEKGAYDLVANTGAVTWEGHDIPDVTDDALGALKDASE
jgi:hypothetical protein